MVTQNTVTPVHPRQVQAFASREELLCTRCQRCKRPLKSIPSRRAGYGKTCAEHMGIDYKVASSAVEQSEVQA